MQLSTSRPRAPAEIARWPGQLAAIDMGSNSFRLEIGQLIDGRYRRIDYLKETVQIYKNWPRHFTKNHLALSGDIHNTLYTHDKQSMGFSHISGLSPYLYKHDIQQQVKSLLNKLEIAKLEVL